ncbi:MAG: shikimate dehydrogenase [Planctomycetota bacterium]|jgi:shikimate dehydrogenase|nr:shikimate dehydrogenase [Planctomycetota bacterium]
MSKNYRSQLVGVFGYPVDENPTGVIEEAAFAAKKLDFRYITMLVEPTGLAGAMAGLRAMHFRGVNLTIPHKVEVLKYLDELSPAAKIIGAVNTVVAKEGKLWGDNTDGKGFLASLVDEGVAVAGKKVALLGAGGAARAIGVELALAGAAVVRVVNRDPGRGEDLVGVISRETPAKGEYIPWRGTAAIPGDSDIVVNATPVGLYPKVDDRPDIDYSWFSSARVVADVVFNDPNTLFLQAAAERGAKCINGLGMLVNQGAVNFTLWTGVEAPKDVMTQALKREFGL